MRLLEDNPKQPADVIYCGEWQASRNIRHRSASAMTCCTCFSGAGGRVRVSEGVERMIDEMFSHTQPDCFHSLYSTDKRYGDTRLWSSAPAAISLMTSSLLTGTAGSGFMFPPLCNNFCLLLVPQHMQLPQRLAR